MSPENTSSTRICPTCGTRLNASATRCSVCGSPLTAVSTPPPAAVKAVQPPKMPAVSISLPLAIGLVIVLMLVGGSVAYAALRATNQVAQTTATATVTLTATASQTSAPTTTSTPEPTFTPQPPIEHKVKANETCLLIADMYKVSYNDIITLNNLPQACNTLKIGDVIKVPRPTPTASPQPTKTLNASQATEAACEKYKYTVTSTDTLSTIAAKFHVDMQAIKDYNGLSNDVVWDRQVLIIPLCTRAPLVSPTPTPVATYQPPNLLMPADGATFMAASDVITLQWASVGTLRKNEAYAITIEDITEGTGRKMTEYVTDTKFSVPNSFRPAGNTPHVFRWSVLPVRQSSTPNTDKNAKPTWEQAGVVSPPRVFSWMASGLAATPQP